ncbi:MAG: hypothetical protein B7Z47_07240, partial [Chthoniobacter sp. 12-60-6]
MPNKHTRAKKRSKAAASRAALQIRCRVLVALGITIERDTKTTHDDLKNHQRIAHCGSGAVGCYYGGRLAQHGNDVHFLMRSDYEEVKQHGLKIRSPLGDFNLPHVNCHRSTAEIGPCDLVIIAMKATANEVLLELLPPLLKEKTMILTLQNGLGSDDFLARHFGSARVLGGLCFVCIK